MLKVTIEKDGEKQVFEGDAKSIRGSVWAWLNGINEPKGHHLVELFGLMDASFACEVLAGSGCTVVKLADKRAALAKAQAEYEEAVAIAGGGR